MKYLPVILAAVLATPALADQAFNFAKLRDDTHIEERLTTVSIGYEMQDGCDNISPRWWRVWREKQALEKYAKDQGFSPETIDAYVKSKSEKKRIMDKAQAWISSSLVAGEDICSLARREISRDSSVGYLLRATE